jgi:nicotinamide mononucleotide transporter
LTISVLTLIVGYLLKRYTNSYVPFSDAFTFAGGLVATWMLARKYLEHWLFWLVIDSFSVVLYSIQHLYLTSVLYGVYFVMAVVGYVEWRKTLKENI